MANRQKIHADFEESLQEKMRAPSMHGMAGIRHINYWYDVHGNLLILPDEPESGDRPPPENSD